MLTELRISNFALIEELRLEFTSGFHVFTGETGTGKSILIDAIALVIGGRASVDQIRAEAEEAEVEAAFSLPPTGALVEGLREAGAVDAQDHELIIRRVISRSGRHRLYVNGRLTPLHVVQALAGTWVDIHGQHDQQSLLSSTAQLSALDVFGGLSGLREHVAKKYDRWKARQHQLAEVEVHASTQQQQEELLRYQHQELQEAALRPEEESALHSERNRLAQSRRLGELGEAVYHALYGADAALLGDLGRIQDQLREVEGIEAGAADWVQQCDMAMVHLREVACQVRDYLQQLEHDPNRLVVVEQRLDVIQRLKMKYGVDFSSLLALGEEFTRRLDHMALSQSQVEELRTAVEKDYAEVCRVGAELTRGRRHAAKKLERAIKTEFDALRMAHTRLQVELVTETREGGVTPHGCEQVEFLLSANKGEPLLPLAKVASGGELSRVMLATKTVLATEDQVPTLIFDEIDSGIGGAVAEVMGQRLRALGAFHQVFCVTHLPQIASQADTHFMVEKSVEHGRTQTSVKSLSQHDRLDEIARMLGGITITNAVRKTAAEMMEKVKGRKMPKGERV